MIDLDPRAKRLHAAADARRSELLRLALRTCMTHPAGPFSTLVGLADDFDAGRIDVAGLQALRCEVTTWLAEQDMGEERTRKARQFLAVVFDGKLVCG